jgi:hypothetical protein
MIWNKLKKLWKFSIIKNKLMAVKTNNYLMTIEGKRKKGKHLYKIGLK